MSEHKNFRCKNCLIVDGYTKKEPFCRYCGARLGFLWEEGERCKVCGTKLYLCNGGLSYCPKCMEVFEK